jgi:hypothetical protein
LSPAYAGILLGLLFHPEDGRRYVPPKRWAGYGPEDKLIHSLKMLAKNNLQECRSLMKGVPSGANWLT